MATFGDGGTAADGGDGSGGSGSGDGDIDNGVVMVKPIWLYY
nr:hypothetical protein [Tanacetum cinerariifolium]